MAPIATVASAGLVLPLGRMRRRVGREAASRSLLGYWSP